MGGRLSARSGTACRQCSCAVPSLHRVAMGPTLPHLGHTNQGLAFGCTSACYGGASEQRNIPWRRRRVVRKLR